MPPSRNRALIIGCSLFAALFLALFHFREPPATAGTLPEDAQGKLVFLHFWATWCGPCVGELPSVARLQADYERKGLAVLAYSLDVDLPNRPAAQRVAQFIDKHRLAPLTARIDENETLRSRYGATSLPYTLLIGPDGAVIARFMEPMEWDSPQLRRLIEENLPAQ